MIKILAGKTLDLDIDPNPNGYPYLALIVRYGAKIETHLLLSKDNVEELTKELQRVLTEL